MSGLDDVVAADTALSDVDGLAGRLIICGHSLDELAGRTSSEQVLAMLLAGKFEVSPTKAALGASRVSAFTDLAPHLPSVADLTLFEAVRALVARIPDGTSLETALTLVAAPAVLVPALLRLRQGQPAIAPDPTLGHSADILRMLRGAPALPAEAAALDTYLVTVADHGLNASTFAARIVASTQAGLTSSVLAAMGALKGPLHGGAPGPVLDMIDAVGIPGRAEAVLGDMLARGERLPGFGHRVYRVRDPRADALKAALARLRRTDRLELALAVETTALRLLKDKKPQRPLETNVEYFTALLLDTLGFPRDAFTAVFAMGRTGGWIAHAREQAISGRLIRPKSRYIGPTPMAAA
ncbi:MAG TPA: citrate synthase/methylcitrate synthase [Devosia sp.]|nr:citrate synthase/methylcitrate synthase [Devosia sp.]